MGWPLGRTGQECHFSSSASLAPPSLWTIRSRLGKYRKYRLQVLRPGTNPLVSGRFRVRLLDRGSLTHVALISPLARNGAGGGIRTCDLWGHGCVRWHGHHGSVPSTNAHQRPHYEQEGQDSHGPRSSDFWSTRPPLTPALRSVRQMTLGHVLHSFFPAQPQGARCENSQTRLLLRGNSCQLSFFIPRGAGRQKATQVAVDGGAPCHCSCANPRVLHRNWTLCLENCNPIFITKPQGNNNGENATSCPPQNNFVSMALPSEAGKFMLHSFFVAMEYFIMSMCYNYISIHSLTDA